MDVSIIIVSFNTVDITLGCLRSIIEQTRDSSFEIIVVDNASTDGTPERIASEFPKVRLLRNAANMGVAAAATEGLKIATGRYVITMNTDVVVLNGAIDKLVNFMDEHPEVGGATPKLLLGDGSNHPSPFADPPTPLCEYLRMLSIITPSLARALASRFGLWQDPDLDVSQEVACVQWGTCFIVRRETMEEVGYQDPLFYIYCEDVDWSLRIKKAGWAQWYIADIEVIHFGGQSSGPPGNAMMTTLLTDSRIKLMHKHYGLLAALIYRGLVGSVGALGYAKWSLHPSLLTSGGRAKAFLRRNRFGAMLRAAVSWSNSHRRIQQ